VNPLDQYPKLRKALYLAQWVLNGVTGVLGIVFTAQGDTPEWYVLTVAVLAFVWTYAGITAQTNVTPTEVPMPKHLKNEKGVYQFNWLTVVVLVLIIFIFLIVAGFIDVHH
jgi:4-hydroxybenzoate polyprenyltransferase